VVESFAAGCLHVVAGICRATDSEIAHVVVHGLRPETPADFAREFPPSVGFLRWLACRQVNPVRDVFSLAHLLLLLRHVRPDVVHCHSSKAGAIGRIAARILGIPVIYTPHGFAFQRTDIPPIARKCFLWAERRLARAGDCVMAVGEDEARIARDVAGDRCIVRMIPNAVECDALWALAGDARSTGIPRGENVADGAVILGTMGRASPQHDAALFGGLVRDVGAMSSENDASPRPGIRWVWIGGEPDFGTADAGVEATGWLDREDALRRLADLDVYVNVSRWDGLSMATLEAMAMGKPVVATDIPATREIVRHGKTGLLCGDRQAMAAALRRLVNDPALRRSMGDAGRRMVKERHDIAVAAAGYVSLYRAAACAEWGGSR
jgi:glycosyltransferase involved in cell wall biosynthesis